MPHNLSPEYIAHTLAHAHPTQQSASVISSPYYTAYTLPKLAALSTAFRHAFHIHYARQPSGMRQWSSAVLKGLQGGQPLLRLVACSGLLLAAHDLKVDSTKDAVESESVLSLAEIMDMYSTEWEQDWSASFPSPEGMDVWTLALVSSTQSLILVSPQRLQALPLHVLLKLLSSTISTAFQSGDIFSTPSELIQSPLLEVIASISKLASLSLSLLLRSQPQTGLTAAEDILQLYCTMAQRIEASWLLSPLSRTDSDSAKSIWTVMKTMLFSMIMVTESALSSVPFVRPKVYLNKGPYPQSLALITLHTLSHLSFVVSQFGGLTTSSSPNEGFKELKRAFYLALDILASDNVQSERFVRESCASLTGTSTTPAAKFGYTLACIEQLAPVVSVDCIQNVVFPFCQPQLYNSKDREIFESAHSVVLAIFTAQSAPITSNRDLATFAENMIPFYTNCLIENSKENQLNTLQLQLAFSALTMSAGNLDEQRQNHVLTQYCIDALLGAMQPDIGSARLHRLHLMLISSVSSLSLHFLPQVLESIQHIIASADGFERRELSESLFREIMEKVGDQEKEFAMRWWYECSAEFRPVFPVEHEVVQARI